MAYRPKFPVPRGRAGSRERFQWLQTFGGRFKREKSKGETFTKFMQRIGIWGK